jgi:hypothetical protein
MNHRLSQILLEAAMLPALIMLGGCASDQKLITLSPVGPSSRGSGGGSGPGYLVVYSASHEMPDHDGVMIYPHSAYKVYDARKACVKRVSNQSGAHCEIPERVDLPPGRYTVVADSEDKGTVVVPVIIESQLKTVVNLEGPAHTISGSSTAST